MKVHDFVLCSKSQGSICNISPSRSSSEGIIELKFSPLLLHKIRLGFRYLKTQTALLIFVFNKVSSSRTSKQKTLINICLINLKKYLLKKTNWWLLGLGVEGWNCLQKGYQRTFYSAVNILQFDCGSDYTHSCMYVSLKIDPLYQM